MEDYKMLDLVAGATIGALAVITAMAVYVKRRFLP